MALEKRNILLGAGRLWVAPAGTALPTFSANATAVTAMAADADWTELGYTTGGVEIGYAPEYSDIDVDQSKDSVMQFNTGLSITMSTTLAEATLANLRIAWGSDDDADDDVLNLAVLPEEAAERSLVVIGRAPRSATNKKRERVYYARRVVSVEGSNHSLQRDDMTQFPVSFRLLPDPTVVGAEYGSVTDRLIEA